jgi:hypothetical protein
LKFIVIALAPVLLLGLAAAQTAPNSRNARVFVTDSQSWQMSGNSGGSSNGFGSHSSGGASPQTGEIIKTFGERCPQVVVNNKADRADYVVLLDHEGGKGYARKDNKIAIFNSDGDSILSRSTRSLGSAVKDACEAISSDWPTRATRPVPTPAQEVAQAGSNTASKISISSTPANADIEVDGSFVGNTPSVIDVTAGEHSVVVRKTGFTPWERKLKISGGSVNVAADLVKMQ